MKPAALIIACLALPLGLLTAQTAAGPTPEPLPLKKPATEGQVWGALIYATDHSNKLTGSAEKFPESHSDIPERLKKVFPHQHLEIIGQHLQDVFREFESWVVPTKDLFLKVDYKGPTQGGGMNLHLQFWRDEQVLVKTDTVLRKGSPLFIAGPKWREGQLLFVLVLQ